MPAAKLFQCTKSLLCRGIILTNKSGTKFGVCGQQPERFEVYFFEGQQFQRLIVWEQCSATIQNVFLLWILIAALFCVWLIIFWKNVDLVVLLFTYHICWYFRTKQNTPWPSRHRWSPIVITYSHLQIESIAVGCVPSAAVTVWGGGLFARGVSAWGCLSRGGVSQHALWQIHPPQNDWQRGAKTLPFRNFVYGW